MEELAEDKYFQELLEEKAKAQVNWCYKHLRYTSQGLEIHGDKSDTEGPSV